MPLPTAFSWRGPFSLSTICYQPHPNNITNIMKTVVHPTRLLGMTLLTEHTLVAFHFPAGPNVIRWKEQRFWFWLCGGVILVSIKPLRFGSLLSATGLVRSVLVTSWGYWEKLQNARESVLVNNNAGKGQQKDHAYAIYPQLLDFPQL